MQQFGITLYYTDNHPSNGQPFYTEQELIQEARDIFNQQDDNSLIITTNDAITYLQDQGYGNFHETIQYFNDYDITYVDIEHCGKSTIMVPYLKLENINQTETLKTFLKTYDSLSQFTERFIEQEKEVILDDDWADIKDSQEADDFKQLNEDGKYGFALGHSYSLLNKYLYSPLSKLLNDYDLGIINDWFSYVQLKN